MNNDFWLWLLEQLNGVPASLLQEGANSDTTDRLLTYIIGEREAAEVRALLNKRPDGEQRHATVFLPGLLGSLLASIRGLSALLWFNPTIISSGQINLLDLGEDGQSDRSPDVEILPIGVEKITYLRLIVTLAQHSRLYEFPYDWRRHVESNADVLHHAIERWVVAVPERRFTIVCHSLGGLVARAYLARYPKTSEQRIERVIMIGTPLHGTPLASLIFTDTLHPGRLVNRINEQNDIAGLTRNLPSIYQLLPAPQDLYALSRDYPMNWDIYDAHAWQVDGVRQDYLDDARRYHQLIASSDPQTPLMNIAGCHRRTVTDVWHAIGRAGKQASAECPFTVISHEIGTESGDEQVPLWSVEHENVETYYVEQGHNSLPGDDRVVDAVVRLLHGDPIGLPSEVPAPSHPLQRLRSTPLLRQAQELRQQLRTGRLSPKDIERFFFAR